MSEPNQNAVPFVVGQASERTTRITAVEIDLFVRLTGDDNPVHVDDAAAARTRFGRRIAHGMLTAGLITGVLGTTLPGPGAIYLSQSLRFLAPVFIGDTITARVEVLEVLAEKRRVRVATTCRNQDGVNVIEGEALLLIPGAA